jgi:dihydroorotate dehydrogenase (NAD+) catalytic subunit
MAPVRLGRITLPNPVTVASGTFGVEYGDYYDLNTLGALVTKTITLEPREGNPPPRLLETPHGLLNSIGLQNPGLERFLAETLPQYARYTPPLIVSFSGAKEDDFIIIAKALSERPEIAALEMNVSCPNVEREGLAFGTDPEVVERLTAKVRAVTDHELIVKLTPNVTDIVAIAKAAVNGGADSLALINTVIGLAIDPVTDTPWFPRGIAGYSGPAIKPIALANVWKVAQAVKAPIIGMGGICSVRDAQDFLCVGAVAFAVGTGQFAHPNLVPELVAEFGKSQ